MSDKLQRLVRLHGIEATYHDIWGTSHRVSDDTLRAVLAAMGVDASNDTARDDALRAAMRRRWRRVMDAAIVVREDASAFIVPLRLPERFEHSELRWRVLAEDGREWSGTFDATTLPRGERADVEGAAYVTCELTLRLACPCGYHRCSIADGDTTIAEASLIVTPVQCYLPPQLFHDGRAWGIAAQLYGLRSRTNYGSGDFSDLRALAAHCASVGGSVVGLNPLHARNTNDPAEASPYAASSRLFLDPQYLDVQAIADFAESDEARSLVASTSFQSMLRGLRESELVDRAGAAAARNAVLELLYSSFRARHLANGSARAEAFQRFNAEGGEPLRRYTLFEALHEHFCRDATLGGWPTWPPPYRDPAGPAVAAFEADHRERAEFFAYLQWQADRQLAAACRGSAALSIGLYRDLAVSVDRAGAEAWAYQHCYATGSSVGAPPDDFSLLGQDWGIAPWIPSQLSDDAYAPFIAILRANMRHAGALRIDHVMSLSRLFWIPHGAKPADGAYVTYPLDDMLGIVALESHRNGCLIIGEDLGTVPDNMRRALEDARVLSYDVFYFERRSSGDFKSPSEYDAQSIAVATTHDLPTLAGWWAARDLQLRETLGLFPSAQARDQQLASRAHDRARLLQALEQARLLPEGVSTDPAHVPEMTPDLAQAIHVYLARTPAKLAVIQLEDVVGALDQTNLPGTTTEHPNWRRKLALSLEELPRDRRFDDVARALSRERPNRRNSGRC
ncbi:MAG TPA: 4-alpha-glucanotransferase [Casimicrobiaceae bacterium]|jgi:(1->4)-alpha-D-glucan 1-alpha-D-glucosylmutase